MWCSINIAHMQSEWTESGVSDWGAMSERTREENRKNGKALKQSLDSIVGYKLFEPNFPVWLLFVFGSRNKQISKHKRILFFFNISSWYFSTYICFGWCVWMCVPICHPTTKCVFVFVSLYVCVAEYVTKMVFGLKISKLTWAKLLCAWICVWYISEWGKETTVAHNCYLYHAYASNGMYMYSLMVIFMIIGIHRKNQIEQTFQFRREWAHNSANWMDDGGGWGPVGAKGLRRIQDKC